MVGLGQFSDHPNYPTNLPKNHPDSKLCQFWSDLDENWWGSVQEGPNYNVMRDEITSTPPYSQGYEFNLFL